MILDLVMLTTNVNYCGLNTNGPGRLTYSNALSAVGGRTVWEGPGGVTFLKEVCHWDSSLRFQKPTPFQLALSLLHGCCLNM